MTTLLLDTVLAPAPQCVAAARDAVDAVLAEVGLEPLADDVCLLTSELVTNGVRHARTPLALWVEWDGHSVRVALKDRDRRPPQPRPNDPKEPGGLGLAIIDAVASRWGYEREADGAKVVWFELEALDGALAGSGAAG